jgi:7-keto-8-aminopelargonate synthetase-like enzyme
MDLFEKCFRSTAVRDAREAGLYPYFHALESRQDVEVMMEGKRRIMLGSNNYLGLTIHPDVINAGIEALDRYCGCTSNWKPSLPGF